MKSILETSRPAILGILTALGATTSVLVLCALFEVVNPIYDLTPSNLAAPHNANARFLILYSAAGGSHILLCTLGTFFLLFRLRSEQTKFELRKTIACLITSFIIISAVVILFCYLNTNLVKQSYIETMLPLQNDPRFGMLMERHRIPVFGSEFQTFASIPLFLVLFGVLFSVTACFWMAHQAVDFLRKASDLKPTEIAKIKRRVAQLIALMAIVFTTSALSTIIFLQIGRDWIQEGSRKIAYIQNGYAMAIFWSVCYTAIFLLILTIPLFWVTHRTKRFERQAKYAAGTALHFDEIYRQVSYKFLAQIGTAIISPVITSSVAAILGS
jgi:hypothetical protein